MRIFQFILLGISLLILPIRGFAGGAEIDGLFGVQLGANLIVEKKEVIRDAQKQFMIEYRIPSPLSYPGSVFNRLNVIVNGKGKVAAISGDVVVKDDATCKKHKTAIYELMAKQYQMSGRPEEYIYQYETAGRLRLAGARCYFSADLSEARLSVNVIDRILIEQIEKSYSKSKK